MKKQTFLFALISLVLIFSHCRKEETQDQDVTLSTDIMKENAQAEALFDDVANQTQIGMVQAEDSTSNKKSGITSDDNGATITISPFDFHSFPKTIEIDFGSTGVTGYDGKIRKGKITIETTGWYRDSGTVITINTENYEVDNFEIAGEKTITNNGTNVSGNIYYSIDIEGSISDSEGTTEWTSQRIREWIAGEDTFLNPWDDEYLITGTQTGLTKAGENYEIEILTPLHVKLNCRWLTSGSLQITTSSLSEPAIVDYGNGECNSQAVVSYKGKDYSFYMTQ